MADKQTPSSGDFDDMDAPPVARVEAPDAVVGPGVNPAEQEALARDLGEELTDLFVRYVRGEVEFADLTFMTYDLLHDLHVVASGAYELEYDEDEEDDVDEDEEDDFDGAYDEVEATEEQEELAQEPSRP